MAAKDNYSIIRSYAKSPEIVQRFTDIVGERWANSYIYSAIIAVSADPRLQQCTPGSIMKSAARAATLNLSCDPDLGQAYLVPYKDQAELNIGWRGLRDLAYRTGKYKIIHAGKLYEGQLWIENQLTGEAQIEGSRTGPEIIGYFAFFRRKDNTEKAVYMSKSEIHAHKEQYAPGWNRKDSAWQKEFDKMATKTVLRKLLKTWGEMDMVTQIESIEATESIEEFPEPDQVTIIEPPKKSESEILKELGFDEEEATVTVIKPPEEEPEPPEETEKPTNYPGSESEYYSWIVQGAVAHVGVKDAKKILEDSKHELDIAWELALSLSKERQTKNQPNLI